MQTQGTALITGASSGIGAIYADRLARRGHDLILVARDLDKLEALATRLRRDTGRAITTLKADLTASVELRVIEHRLRTDPRITILVNNAGLGSSARVMDSDPDFLEELISINVTALTRLARAAAPGMVARRTGAIINVASIAALTVGRLNGTYGASKAYVLAFTQALHHELKDSGVRVQALLPGAIDTPFWDRAGLPVDQLPSRIVMTPENLVDAALAGFDMGELVTLPALPDNADWERFDAARLALGPNLSHAQPAARYNVKA